VHGKTNGKSYQPFLNIQLKLDDLCILQIQSKAFIGRCVNLQNLKAALLLKMPWLNCFSALINASKKSGTNLCIIGPLSFLNLISTFQIDSSWKFKTW